MAPTTLIGQKTSTTPKGRDASLTGYPLHVSEMLATIEGTSLVVRTSLDTPHSVLKTKALIEKAFRYQMEGKGFSFVEILSPCPTDWGLCPKDSLEWLRSSMMSVYKTGVLRDRYGSHA